jgi:serine/threonine protein kinase
MIRGAGLPPCEVLTYGRSVAETLCYLAGLPQPVVHCDIKPANLILPPGGRAPVLIDFGGALHVPNGDQPVTRLDRYGTPGYAAPEQYAGVASPRSDVYSLAATLYHLLTGDDPGAHPLAFPVLGVLPTEVAAVLEPALVRDPAARPEPRLFSASLRELAAQYTVPQVAAA